MFTILKRVVQDGQLTGDSIEGLDPHLVRCILVQKLQKHLQGAPLQHGVLVEGVVLYRHRQKVKSPPSDLWTGVMTQRHGDVNPAHFEKIFFVRQSESNRMEYLCIRICGTNQKCNSMQGGHKCVERVNNYVVKLHLSRSALHILLGRISLAPVMYKCVRGRSYSGAHLPTSATAMRVTCSLQPGIYARARHTTQQSILEPPLRSYQNYCVASRNRLQVYGTSLQAFVKKLCMVSVVFGVCLFILHYQVSRISISYTSL